MSPETVAVRDLIVPRSTHHDPRLSGACLRPLVAPRPPSFAGSPAKPARRAFRLLGWPPPPTPRRLVARRPAGLRQPGPPRGRRLRRPVVARLRARRLRRRRPAARRREPLVAAPQPRRARRLAREARRPLMLRHGDAEPRSSAVAAGDGAGPPHDEPPLRRGRARAGRPRRGRAAAQRRRRCTTTPRSLLHEPGEVLNGEGERFAVFTPFFRALHAQRRRRARPIRRRRASTAGPARSTARTLDALGLLPTDAGLVGRHRRHLDPRREGRAPAARRLRAPTGSPRYADAARPARRRRRARGSPPHLKFGEISPYQLWHRVQQADASRRGPGEVPHRARLARLRLRPARHGTAHLDTVNVHRELRRVPLGGSGRRACCARGSRAAPASRSSTRACGSSGRPAGCTTACAWSPRRSSSRTSADRLADRRAVVLGHARRRRPGEQRRAVAVGRRLRRRRRALLPRLQPRAQAKKFDPDGDYIRQWVPELRDASGKALHEPWTAGDALDEGGQDATRRRSST